MSCRFKNILGESGKGVHSIRIFNISVVDVLLTFLIAYLTKGNCNYFIVLAIWFILGIILHHIFCVKTTIGQLIFGSSLY
jgi:uncharacterized membrane protein